MPPIRAQVALQHDSGLAEDAVVNTFHFDSTLTQTASIAQIRANIANFYSTTNAPFLGPVSSFLSSELSGSVTMRLYNLSDAEPRVPFDEHTFTIVPGTGTPMPSEVAYVLSFQGAKISGQPQARRRGRIFLGPMDSSAGAVLNGVARPATGMRDVVRAAAIRLKSDSNANSTFWSIFSPTDNAMVRVDNGWLDNAWDTQRRRGARPSLKTTWT